MIHGLTDQLLVVSYLPIQAFVHSIITNLTLLTLAKALVLNERKVTTFCYKNILRKIALKRISLSGCSGESRSVV